MAFSSSERQAQSKPENFSRVQPARLPKPLGLRSPIAPAKRISRALSTMAS